MFFKTLVVSLMIVAIVALIGSAVNYDMNWYESSKPSFSPPDWLFGVVWTILYIMIAFSLTFAWTSAKRIQKRKLSLLFGVNLAANAIWTIIFFGMHLPLLALVDLAIIWLSTLSLIIFTRKIDKRAAWLLVPYLVWVSLAAVLNAAFL